MPVPYVSRTASAAPARVDVARLRELLATAERLEADARATGEAVDQVTHTVDDVERDVEASARATDARVALTRAVRADLPALLDEVDTARKLVRDVLEHGLSSAEPLRARALYARLEAAGKGG